MKEKSDKTSSRHYTRLLYCFPIPETVSAADTETLVSCFRHASSQIQAKWPFLGGKIRLYRPEEPAGPVKLCESRDRDGWVCNGNGLFSTDGVLSVKRVHDWGPGEVPSYRDLAARGVPPDMIRSRDYCRISHLPDLAAETGAVVYHIGLNFIRGGLMLCVCYSNLVLDYTAHAIILEELALQVSMPCKEVRERDRTGEKTYPDNQPWDVANWPSIYHSTLC
ncbi:hypothetical protein QQZ08_009975 [Neonectria magnoliae]|uniref:Uncharacterized protein n=1 Tax=Neonectria magnoliae TaxID=2732573 RepID=A0ABR1HJR3_9HYPO